MIERMIKETESKEITIASKDKIILGISVIQSLVTRVISDPTQILSGLKQILFFYRLLPPEWKKKAFWIFEKLWDKKRIELFKIQSGY